MLIAAALITIALVTLIGWRDWLPPGIFKTIFLFIGGALPVVLLYIARIPPKWFAGTALGFGIGALTLVSAFAGRTASERAFRAPFLSGFGLALLAMNVWAHL